MVIILNTLQLPPELSRDEIEKVRYHVTFTVTPEQKKKYDSKFNSLEPQAGLLSEEKVRNIFNDYLPVSSVDKIWSLSDQDGDGCLDRYEWTVAIHLTVRAMDGDPIPDQVVLSLIS